MTGIRDLKYRQWFRGADVDGDGVITREDVRLMGERYIAARGAAPESTTARRLTDGLDTFWANVIDQEEFREIFSLAGNVSAEDCAVVFDALDLDGSGGLNRTEFHRALEEFFYGDDPHAPAAHLFGRIAG